MNLLFWNTAKRDLNDFIADLTIDTKADILAIAEYMGDPRNLLEKLHSHDQSYLLVPNIACDHITLLSKYPLHSFHPQYDTNRYTIKEIRIAGCIPILLVVIHLPSKRNLSEDDQHLRAQHLREQIQKYEKKVGHRNTIVVGDFNMNPFDKGMMSASALNSIPCSHTARKGNRTIDGKEFDFFYNPSWNLLGDREKPPGTYFHSSPSSLSHYWNTLDQVILRPEIIDRLSINSLQTLKFAGTKNLADANHRPQISDHFPIAFNFNSTI